MKTLNLIATALTTATLMITAPGTALAHSGHEKQTLPLVWEFNDSVHEKISRAMNDETRKNKIGLSHLEQTILKRYGIRVGDSFYTPVNGWQIRVERTQGGLRIVDSAVPAASDFKWRAPITENYEVMRSSVPAMEHFGHQHSHLNIAWLFDPAITDKIKSRLDIPAYPMMIGLSKTEQKIVDRYGIEVGHSFVTTVGGVDYLVKRASSGLQVMKEIAGNTPVAARPMPVDGKAING